VRNKDTYRRFVTIFIILSLYFLKTENKNNWVWAGIVFELIFTSRYPTLIEATIIFVVESIIRKDRKFATRTIMIAMPILLVIHFISLLKSRVLCCATTKRQTFYIFVNSLLFTELNKYIGICFLVPIAFLFRRTYTDKFNYTFIASFIVSLFVLECQF